LKAVYFIPVYSEYYSNCRFSAMHKRKTYIKIAW